MEFTQTMEHVIKELAVIRKVYAKAFSESFVHESFSPNEVNILIFLARNPSLNTGRDLSICLDVSKGLICRSVDALIKKEMITARDDPDDRRIQRLVLTKKADPVIQEIFKVNQEISKDIFQGIPEEEIVQMEKTLRKIIQKFHERLEII